MANKTKGFFKKCKTKLKEKRKLRKSKTETEKALSFTKKVLAFIVINAEIQIYMSYVLAAYGRDLIAEELSKQVVVTVVGAFIAYAIKSLIENLSKYNLGSKLSSEKDGNDEDCSCISSEDFLEFTNEYEN